MPASAFWWQWPWNRIRRGPRSRSAARRRRSPRRAAPRRAACAPRRRVSPSSATCSSRSVSRHDGSTPVIVAVAGQALGQRLGLGVRVVEQALGDRRAPAAAAALQPHVVARGVEQLDRRAADAGLGERRERVGEEDDLAAARRARRAACSAQRISVSRSKRGSGRRRSIPATCSSSRARDRQVRQRRGRGAEPVERADRAEQPRAQRRAVDRVVVREELGLHRRHVDRQRALALARLALEAEVEDLVQALVAQRGSGIGLAQRLHERVRPPAGGVLLLARGHVGRAHHAAAGLAAGADALAAVGGGVHRRPRGSRSGSTSGLRLRVARRRAGATVSGSASTITPGLRMPVGSNSRLTSRIAP